VTMVERVARAMFDAECRPHKALTGYCETFGWDDAMPAVRGRLMASAQAAIDTMAGIDAWIPALVSVNWTLSSEQVGRLYRQVLETALLSPDEAASRIGLS
jgi:hypothetical protein